jgi:hypothetical protein
MRLVLTRVKTRSRPLQARATVSAWGPRERASHTASRSRSGVRSRAQALARWRRSYEALQDRFGVAHQQEVPLTGHEVESRSSKRGGEIAPPWATARWYPPRRARCRRGPAPRRCRRPRAGRAVPCRARARGRPAGTPRRAIPRRRLLDEAVLPQDLLGRTELQQEVIDDALVDAQGVTPVSCRVARIRSHTRNWTGPDRSDEQRRVEHRDRARERPPNYHDQPPIPPLLDGGAALTRRGLTRSLCQRMPSGQRSRCAARAALAHATLERPPAALLSSVWERSSACRDGPRPSHAAVRGGRRQQPRPPRMGLARPEPAPHGADRTAREPPRITSAEAVNRFDSSWGVEMSPMGHQ